MTTKGQVVITLVDGNIHEGTVYAVDPVTQTIILKLSSDSTAAIDSYTVINPSQISKLQGNLNDTVLPNISTLGIK